MRSALIVGSEGQDGRLVGELLECRQYRVLGLHRTGVTARGIDWSRPVDITRFEDVEAVVRAVRPDEIYHLAAIHHSSTETHAEDLEGFRRLYEVNFFSLLHFLEAARLVSPGSRLFFAASSHVFGRPDAEIQDETTPLRPDSIYAMTKADGLLACRLYRETHRLFASTGILYTHESRYRDEKFLSMKIVRAALRIRTGAQRELLLGRLDARVDWGFAPDYVEAMQRILEAPEAGEFVVSTGTAHSVQDFVRIAFEAVGLDWRNHVREDPSLITRDTPLRIGNPGKLRAVTGWSPKTGFASMIHELVRSVEAAT
ncbi:MAG TPA: GDP-mannose 4,6-dehydratase [Candidatus Polarisedimenticolia bacterium]|nr:GDP-mannose 4,6-dehydratase [Candidatus Polarisedimenticolia bacterium]